jgi:Cu/Ag efflux pump CusA
MPAARTILNPREKPSPVISLSESDIAFTPTRLGLPATAFGELYQYTLCGPMTPMELKDLQEWQIKRQLRTVPGVSEVNNWGGEIKQYQITVDPALLMQYVLTLRDVAQRVAENNANFGGGYIEHNDEQYTLRGEAARRASRTSATSSCYRAAGFPSC